MSTRDYGYLNKSLLPRADTPIILVRETCYMMASRTLIAPESRRRRTWEIRMSAQQKKRGRSTVERIAAFASNANLEHLDFEVRRTLKRNVLDSLGCVISALSGPPFRAPREQFDEYRMAGTCTLIGGGTSSADQAALFNSALVRYVDLLDSYMSPGGLCHPSDNFGAVLAAAEHVNASGEQFLLALAVAYEVQCRITAAVPVMAKGFNHAIQLAMSVAAASGKLFGLTEGQIANAISIAAVDNVSLSCVHSEPVSQWKGFSPGITGMRAVYVTSLAKRGVTGPLRVFEGPNGLERMFNQPIPVDWENPSLAVVKQTVMKKFCSLIHGQPVLEATLDLKRRYDLTAGDIGSVACDIFQSGYDIAGGTRAPDWVAWRPLRQSLARAPCCNGPVRHAATPGTRASATRCRAGRSLLGDVPAIPRHSRDGSRAPRPHAPPASAPARSRRGRLQRQPQSA